MQNLRGLSQNCTVLAANWDCPPCRPRFCARRARQEWPQGSLWASDSITILQNQLTAPTLQLAQKPPITMKKVVVTDYEFDDLDVETAVLKEHGCELVARVQSNEAELIALSATPTPSSVNMLR